MYSEDRWTNENKIRYKCIRTFKMEVDKEETFILYIVRKGQLKIL